MNILIVHNQYLQPGGEDIVFQSETSLLKKKNNIVNTFIKKNQPITKSNFLKIAINVLWSKQNQKLLKKTINQTKPDIVHFHNTFFQISPAAYYACKDAGIPVVQTLHNYRLICPGALLIRNGKICTRCVKKNIPWPGVLHGCWRRSRAGTAIVATMLVVHRLLKTWTEKVDVYIALTEFARKKFIEGGLPAEKIVVKPNFVYPDPGEGEHKDRYFLFVGRLSSEKGIMTLLDAWKFLKDIPLKIVGDGPLKEEIQTFIEQKKLKYIEVLGPRLRKEVFELMKKARALIFPSEWYEGFPMTLAEAFATGLPVIASRLGAMAELVDEGRTGLLFEPGSSEDLAVKVEWVWMHPKEMAEMGHEARREYEVKYTAERNYEMLMEIYHKVIERCRSS